MDNIQELTKYIKNTFDLYDIDKSGFFFEYDENLHETVDIPLFPNDQIDEDVLNRVCVSLGLTRQEVLSMDAATARKYWNKYPFICLYRDYLSCWEWYSQYKSMKPSELELIQKIIFSKEDNIFDSYDKRYDYQDIRQRMIEQLHIIDAVMPGTYHEGAEITNLCIHTETFFSFPECSRMIQSFLQMVERLKELFFRAIHAELPDDDIREMNFLASYLYATDAVMPSVVMTYDVARLYRNVYLEENSRDFFSYVKIGRFIKTEPWRCKEFFENMNAVQDFVNVFPQAKTMMREFAMSSTKFYCSFVWSDAKPIVFSPEDELELSEISRSFGEKEPTWEERAKEPTAIYVNKTVDELGSGAQYAQRLQDAAAPERKGGLHLPVRELPVGASAEAIARIQKRVFARNGGCR